MNLEQIKQATDQRDLKVDFYDKLALKESAENHIRAINNRLTELQQAQIQAEIAGLTGDAPVETEPVQHSEPETKTDKPSKPKA